MVFHPTPYLWGGVACLCCCGRGRGERREGEGGDQEGVEGVLRGRERARHLEVLELQHVGASVVRSEGAHKAAGGHGDLRLPLALQPHCETEPTSKD
eukprot:1195371-Prorocentrum_minimum.AAC.5